MSNTLILSRGMIYQPNTEKAFDEVIKHNNKVGYKQYSILGPNIMVTEFGDIVLNHDDIVKNGKNNRIVKIRKCTREQINDITISQIIDGHDYGSSTKYMFLDQFLDKYLNNYNIFLDIKNRMDSSVSSEFTAKILINFLSQYRDRNEKASDNLFNKIYFDSDNPETVKQINKHAINMNIEINSMYDYNDFSIKLCDCFYDTLFSIYDYFYPSNYFAFEKRFATQKRIDKYKKNGKKIVVWGFQEEDVGKLLSVDMWLI